MSKNRKDIIVSQFENYKSTVSKDVNLWAWLSDSSRKSSIDYLRTIKDKEERNKYKATLPCITPSGKFSERKLSGLINHSGFICIDIDSGDNPQIDDFQNLRNQLGNIKNLAFCSLSASGKGVFCLIPIKQAVQHKQHFESLKLDFKQLNIIIDKGCGDVTRLRGATYDPDAFLNMNAIEYVKVHNYEVKPSLNFYSSKPQLLPKQSNSMSRVKIILNKIEKTCIDITENYEQWFQIGCALANEFGEEGREIYHEVSRYHSNYSYGKTDAKFNDCLKGGYSYSIGTFFHWAEEYQLI